MGPLRRHAQHAAALAAACAAVVVAAGAACPRGAIKPLAPVNPSRVWNMPERAVCQTSIGAPTVAGSIGSEQLVEASGVVASPTHPGVLWMHNDSGDSARVFAVSTTGEDLGQVSLVDVDAVDFEDIAAAPCPDLTGPCIYVADTGDNARERANVVVYAFAEPDVDPEHPLVDASAQVWRFPLRDESGPIDVEAFVVLPDATAMIFYEKSNANARIFKYAAPWTPDTIETLEVTGAFTPPGPTFGGANLPTSADIHTSGTRLVLRTYGGAFEAKLENGITADHIDGSDFTELFLGPSDEPQGEAVAYDDDGTGLFLVSESPDRTPHQPLNHASCE